MNKYEDRIYTQLSLLVLKDTWQLKYLFKLRHHAGRNKDEVVTRIFEKIRRIKEGRQLMYEYQNDMH